MAKRKKGDVETVVAWLKAAPDVAEAARRAFPKVGECSDGPDADGRGLRDALNMLEFLGAIVEDAELEREDYATAYEEQQDDYPGLARGLMLMARIAGMIARPDENDVW